MSVTFWCPDAPTEPYVPYPDKDPDYVEQRSTLPELNLANSNAVAMLELMGLSEGGEADYGGTATVDRIPAVIERLQRVLQDPVERAAALEPPTVNNMPSVPGQPSLSELLKLKVAQMNKGPTMYGGGRSDEYVRSRASALLQVFQAALSQGYSVSWS